MGGCLTASDVKKSHIREKQPGDGEKSNKNSKQNKKKEAEIKNISDINAERSGMVHISNEPFKDHY